MVDDLAFARDVLRRHGLPDAEPVPATRQGDVNRTYLAGDLVVRVVKPEPEALADWRTEILAHPYVQAKGLRTPRLVAQGPRYTILERIEGRNMDAGAPEAFFWSLGGQLARLHALSPPDDPEGALDVHGSERIALDLLPVELRSLGESLADAGDATGTAFIHGDVTPGNVLVGPGDEAFLIDWGDAGHGHPAYDLCAIPLAGLRAVLDAYGGTDAEFRRRLVALRLGLAADRMDEGDSSWVEDLVANRVLLERLVA